MTNVSRPDLTRYIAPPLPNLATYFIRSRHEVFFSGAKEDKWKLIEAYVPLLRLTWPGSTNLDAQIP